MDDNGHGTHVSGIVASNDSTYRGVAPEANLVMVKSFSAGGGATSQDIANGIKWCKDNKDTFNISVVSMSFGNGGTYSGADCPPDSLIDPEIIAAHDAGLLLIASAGNYYYSPGVSYPACKPYVVAIGATGRNDSVVQSFSKSGDTLDLWAPGASIVSTSKDGAGFITLSGTSMSAPHVSGLAAVVLQYNKLKNSITLSADAVENKLKLTGFNITDSRNGATAPLINTLAAISPIITLESPLNKTYSSGDLNFNITVDSNISSATVEVNGTIYNLTNDSTAHWYNLTIPRAANGTNNATFFVVSDANSSKTVFFTVDQTAPIITLESPANNSNISLGDILNFTVTSSSDVDTVWAEFNGTNSTLASPYDYDTINWTKGLQSITIYANTTAGSINSSFFMFNVNNSAPVFASGQPGPAYTVLVTRPITIIANATDPDNDSVSYTIDTNITSSWTNTTSGGIVTWSWTPNSAEAGNSYYVQFNASDGVKSTSVNTTINVRANNAPLLSTIGSQTATAGSQKIIDFTASDADLGYGDSLSWSDNSAIFNVAKVDATTARATFTPASSQVGTSSVTVTVADIVGASSSKIFTLTINSASNTSANNNNENNLPENLPEESLYDNEKTFGSIPQDTPASFSPNVAGLPVSNIIVETNSNVNDIVTLKIRKLDSAAISAPGSVVNYFELVADGLPIGQIKEVKIQFSVAKAWLTQNGFSKENVRLSTLSGSTWTELPTSVIGEDAAEVRYEASTTHLSDFAIAANKAVKIIPPTTAYQVTNTTAPTAMFAANTGSMFTFLIIAAIVILAITVYMFSKKPKSPAKPKQVIHKKTKVATTREVPDFGFR
jgi:PGF-pre-PGF domain-containing protein